MITIILTSTVNVRDKMDYVFQRDPTDRIKTYLRSILKWLNHTQFNIVLVENSGYQFNELAAEKIKFKDRFEVIVFNESTLAEASYIQNSYSKGLHELFAINYAFKNSKLCSSADFIIKITARFYIPELEEYLQNYDLNNYDCIVQNDRNRCELVGCHSKYFSDIYNMYIPEHRYIIEDIWKKRTSLYAHILICKLFQIDKTTRGGLDEIYTTI